MASSTVSFAKEEIESPDDEYTEEDYAEYQSGAGFYLKKAWIFFQAALMTQFMIRGLIYYYRAKHGRFPKVRILLCF